MLLRKFFLFSSSYCVFLLVAASLQFFNFLATSCIAFSMKTVFHLQFATQVYSLTLSLIDWHLIIVVSEIQAHVLTQLMRILIFSVPYSGSPCYTQSSIIFAELNVHQKWLVELSVQGVLGDLVLQNENSF